MSHVEPHATSSTGAATQSETKQQSPGALLRAARKARGLALDQAARRLRTKAAVLNALENDQFKALGAPVFVRMYLVRYAELLELPEHEVLGRYKRLGVDQPPPLRPSHSIPPQTRASDLRWLTYPAGFALIAWLGWTVTQQQPDWTEEADTGRDIASVEAPGVEAPGVEAPGVEAPGVGTSAVETSTDSPGDESPLAEMPTTETTAAVPEAMPSSDDPLTPDAATSAILAEVDAGEPPSAEETVALATLDGDADAASDDMQGFAEAAADGERMTQPIGSALAGELDPGEPLPGDDQARLVLEFQDECWVEIEDGSGRRLVYGLLSADERRSLTGPAPFSIKLGNARAVQRISFNGEAVDPSLYLPKRGSISRFTLTSPPRG